MQPRENIYYNNEPIGGGNPYYRCDSCKRSDPQISTDGHKSYCEYLALHKLRGDLEAKQAEVKEKMGTLYYVRNYVNSLTTVERAEALGDMLTAARELLNEAATPEDLDAARELVDEKLREF